RPFSLAYSAGGSPAFPDSVRTRARRGRAARAARRLRGGDGREPGEVRPARALLDLLDLLVDAVDGALDLDDGPRDGAVGALAGDRVGLAEQYLGPEVERAAVAPAVGLAQEAAELVEVGLEARDLLGDVRPRDV